MRPLASHTGGVARPCPAGATYRKLCKGVKVWSWEIVLGVTRRRDERGAALSPEGFQGQHPGHMNVEKVGWGWKEVGMWDRGGMVQGCVL